MTIKAPQYDLRPVGMDVVRPVVEEHHGYGSAGKVAVYAFAVYEEGRPVAVYAWQPPPPGAARSVCPEAPAGVLALSRMAAVPRTERRLKHVSTPLRRQMRVLIDRTRWPVLVTYSDSSLGHTGHVYKCSGWERTVCKKRRYFEVNGRRVSSYSNGTNRDRGAPSGTTILQRWEHWACARGDALAFMHDGGWRREAIPGRVYRSGAQAFRWVKRVTA